MDVEHPTYNIHLHHVADMPEPDVPTVREPALLLRRQCNAVQLRKRSVRDRFRGTEATMHARYPRCKEGMHPD